MTHIEVIRGVIADYDDNVLLVKRSLKDSRPGLFEFPGGKQDPEDQDDEATGKREIGEEIGLTIIALKRLIYSSTDTYHTGKHTGKEFAVRVYHMIPEKLEPIRLSDEHDSYCWWPLTRVIGRNVVTPETYETLQLITVGSRASVEL